MIIAFESSINRTGRIKIDEKINLKKIVEKVDSHTSLLVYLFSDSSAIWMPIASDNASAIVNIPPITTSFEWVLECSPTIKPIVVIIPEVKPKLNPTFNECFIMSPYLYLIFINDLLYSCCPCP